MPRRLATFVHVSDLHFGHVDPQTKCSLDLPWWGYIKQCEGLLGHSYVAIKQTSAFFKALRRAENAQIIVTGDLTSCGHPDQFETACDYLGSTLTPTKGGLGMRAPDHLCKGISGNHDKWNGLPFPSGPSTPALRECFPNLPFTHSLPPLPVKSGHFIRFLGIDTDADVGIMDRVFARGRFHSQLAALDNMLPPSSDIDDREIRVLLLHHSRMYDAPNWSSTLAMIDASRRALEDFIVRQNIKVLLCGHTHVPNVEVFDAVALNSQRARVLECCCGTTTQRDSVPPTWTAFWRRWRNWQFKPNSLLVHRVIEDGRNIYWQSDECVRLPTGFSLSVSHPIFQLA